ncbi:MAG: DUF6880 family protein [Thermodesulfobacteriota bacterium]
MRRAIAAFAAGGHFVGYRGSFDLAEELEQLRRAIADQVLPQEPLAAAELLEAFLHLAACGTVRYRGEKEYPWVSPCGSGRTGGGVSGWVIRSRRGGPA